MELNPAGGGESDAVTLESNRQTVDLDWRSASSSDDMRIVTLAASPVPEPATAILSLPFVAYLLGRRRRNGWQPPSSAARPR